MMTQRERVLVMIVGGLLAVLAAYWGYAQVRSAFRRREGLRRQVVEEQQRKQQILDRAIRTSRQLADYESMSLPSNVEIARSQYQGWLSELLTTTGMMDPQVKVISETRRTDGSTVLSLTVSGKGNLQQVTQMLARFYEIELLHRIRILPLRPISDTKQLDVNMTVDALILATAPKDQDLDVAANSLSTQFGIERLTQPIIQRNIFSPANHPPFLGVAESHSIEVDETWSVDLNGSDPDPLDTLTYELLDAPEGARIDSESGALVWKPAEVGEFTFRAGVRDDGIPSSLSEKSFVVQVQAATEPEVTETAEDDAEEGYDDAKYTYAIASIEVSGEAQVWLQIRTRGELQRLKVGDSVQIGSVDGVISKITHRGFEWEANGQTQVVPLGEPLVGS